MISVQQFAEKYEGKSIDFDKAFGAQCVDLFNFYNQDVVGGEWVGTPVTGGARDLWEASIPARDASYRKLPASTKLQIGDVLIYGQPHGRVSDKSGQKFYGHVAVYLGNGRLIQQNARNNQRTTIEALFTTGLLGVLRPVRFINQSEPQKVTTTSQNQHKHVISQGQTFWGLEEENGWPHGTLQELNPQLDPKTLQIGSTIITPAKPSTVADSTETYYNIAAGDTFWALEDAWQLPHGRLQELNPKLDPRKLQIGERIRRS